MPRVYIAGPMTGLPDFNYPAFNSAAARLRADGHDVVNPAEHNLDKLGIWKWKDYMRAAIALLVTCEEVVLLPGWEVSEGANVEHDLALKLQMPVNVYLPE